MADRNPTSGSGPVPGTTTINNVEQRDGLYELVRNHLGSAGDLVDLLERQMDQARSRGPRCSERGVGRPSGLELAVHDQDRRTFGTQ
jgi:hypothetical protein